MGRKGENIFYRKDGRWEARYVKEQLDNGKYKYGYVYGKSYMEAKQKRNMIQLDLERMRQQKIKGHHTFHYYMDLWLESIKFLVKTSTYVHYHSIVKNHIDPYLGHLDLKSIQTRQIESFINQKFEEGLSTKTIRDMIVVLKQILSYANVTVKFKLPKLQKREIQILTKKEQKLLEREVKIRNTPSSYGILLTMYTGLRIGEVCALTWNNIDLNKGVIRIEHTMIRIKDLEAESRTKIVLEEPKTENSKREIPINQYLYDILMRIKSRTRNAYFLTGTKEYIEPRTYYNQYQKILRDLGIPKYGFHALRHTFATNCIEIGMDPKTLSEILGHSDVKVTLSLYVHPTNSLKSVYLEKLSSH